jgi:protein-S-isoprenylcysteine O-methyltransferase Ste14
MFIAVLLISFFPTLFFRHTKEEFLDGVIELFGVVFILLGQIFRVSARGYKSEYSRNGNLLIQGGPYALVRNPMYLGILLIGLGIVLALFNWWVVAIFLLIFATRYVSLIFKEEKRLLARFSKEYADYRGKVPCIFPPIRMLLQNDISEYLPLKLSWLKKEIGSILAVLFMVVLLESWEDIKREGPKVYFAEAAMLTATVILFVGLIIYLNRRTGDLKKNV